MLESILNQFITFVQRFENQQILLFACGFVFLSLCTYFLVKNRQKKQPRLRYKSNKKNRAKLQTSDQKGLLKQLNLSLSKTRVLFSEHLENIFQQKGRLTSDRLDSLHEMLYRSDMGIETVEKLVSSVKKEFKNDSNATLETIKTHLRQKVSELTQQVQTPPIQEDKRSQPHIILIVGVNGVGKTTTIGKLAAHYLAQHKSVLLCAADTFRAAATEQLNIWADRLQIRVVGQKQGADPAAVAFDGVKAAKARKTDVLIVDTAGRLQNKTHLMNELAKIKRVIGIEHPSAPQDIFLVVDATTGQNAFSQVSLFKEFVGLTGLIVTKIDGTAKGGVVVGLSDKFRLPIKYIGVGEQATDLRPFDSKEFASGLF